VLAKVANKSYSELLRERIAAPLEMNDTTVTLSAGQRRRLAGPHVGDVKSTNWDFDALVGCGGIRSSVDDMMKLVAATLSDREDGVYGAIDLSAERRYTMPHNRAGLGLGWHIAGDGTTLWHNGQTGGYHSVMFVNPLNKTGVVILANSSDPTIEIVGERVIQMLGGANVSPPNVRKSIDVKPDVLDRLVGVYRTTSGMSITFARKGDTLMAQMPNQPALRVYPESDTSFFYRDVEAELEFEIDEEDGKGVGVTLRQHGMRFRFERKDDRAKGQ
jgi:CubicO group peptidase (beta-lactamase class C family)